MDKNLEFLLNQTRKDRVFEQKRARDLLFRGMPPAVSGIPVQLDLTELTEKLSEATEIRNPDPVDTEIFSADTGTHIVPPLFKKILLPIKMAFIIRPGSIADLQVFTEWAFNHKVNYTFRGSGTWPFGGCVPLNNDVVVDLSYLDFMQLDRENETLVVGAGALFVNARNYLQEQGFSLRQEITNANSGTIVGWIATGGFGLGSYKYGHVRHSVVQLYVVTPRGELKSLDPNDADFNFYIGSEGQFGCIVGAVIRVRRESFVSKPYAFAFNHAEDALAFIRMVQEARLIPTSMLYFDRSYIENTIEIETRHLEHQSETALAGNDNGRLGQAREELGILAELKERGPVVVMNFDDPHDYQMALKSRLFGASSQQRRINHLSYYQLSNSLAHKLWDHRYLPVQMKQNGPAMLVTETVLPLSALSTYQKLLSGMLGRLLSIEPKTEAHMLPDNEVLVQSIVLADTRTFRHKIYFALVPLMTQIAMHYGAKPYGIGIWNYPLLKRWRELDRDRANNWANFKAQTEPQGQINRGKFLNPRGQRLFFKAFKILIPRFNHWMVATYDKRLQGTKFVLSYPLEKMVWRLSGFVFPRVIPPDLKANGKDPIAELISTCAECDSCERVCPTSDVFGQYGPATPITRRKTAQRLVEGKKISQTEALGFLACTRCDNCTHICPTQIPLTDLFDLVEANSHFQQALSLEPEAKQDFIDRFWQIMKESPLYREHTLADQKEDRSHLAHGIKILYNRGFEYSKLIIDPQTCIHCGMCSHENACMYGAREGLPRQIPNLIDVNCALCNACVNFCPQNKKAQQERQYLDQFIYNATDLEEKKYWLKQQSRIIDTTTVSRSSQLTEMADRYVTEEIIMEIDKESATGQIPVSGMGQGDRHMGIGFDAERFAHFHIVGPAQNRLHEGDPNEELSVILGKREDFCKFDREGNLVNPIHPNIKLMTPILCNTIPLESNGRVELVLIRVAEKQNSLVVIALERLLEHYNYFMTEGKFRQLPTVIIPRLDHELIHRLIVNPNINREFLTDLWRMPVFELEYHPQIERTLTYLHDSVAAVGGTRPLVSGYLEISEYDLIGSLTTTSDIKEKINHFLDLGIDILHINGLRNKDAYYVTSSAVRAIHRYLLRIGRRHEVSIIASGGIRLASDSQKTIQRGAEATLIDFAALLALDPSSYRAIIEKKATTDRLLSLDLDQAFERLSHQAESRKVQILEVLGASGFKDIKKTVGEEGRLIDFHKLEDRLQRSIFEDSDILTEYMRLNQELIGSELIPATAIHPYSALKKRIHTLAPPHSFYLLGEANQSLYKRDFVWPGPLIESMGKMAAGDFSMLDFSNVKGTGLLGDGFDVMKILYNKDPMDIRESELEQIKTAIPLDKGLILEAPWMFGGKSVGSIGLDSWRAHVNAAKALGIQYDTGEGGYPTCFFLNSKGEPIFFTENDIQLIKPLFRSGRDYTIQEMRTILVAQGITESSHAEIYEKIQLYPSLKPFHFMVVVDKEDEPYVSTELKTGLFGVTKETIRRARRVVIAYSQGAKMGIGGHILAKKVNKLVSYLRGIEGIENLNAEKLESLYQQMQKLQLKSEHPLTPLAQTSLPILDQAQQADKVTGELKTILWQVQEQVYNLHADNQLDYIEFENIIRLSEEVIQYSYSSIISPFPFHNCYSIEDVKAFIDIVRMINPQAVVAIKVSPSIDIEFIAAGLGRIARDNTIEIMTAKYGSRQVQAGNWTAEMVDYAKDHGMKIEIWLDGPRGGTGASPNIIKGQMGMHIEYAIPLIHHRLVKDGLRNHVTFMVSGGIRTYEDVIKAVALGADGVIWGTAPMVAIGCDRNRNCHDGCSRGIATSNLIMQRLRDVELNTQQMINAFTMLQMQVMRALAALGFSDLRELRGRFDVIHWMGLKERVDHRFRVRKEIIKEIEKDEKIFEERMAHATAQSNCGVAAINGTVPIPGYILDRTLNVMRNRGMDGVGIAKTLCYPGYPDAYAYRILVKGKLQKDIESSLLIQWDAKAWGFSDQDLQKESRKTALFLRTKLAQKIISVFLEPYFDFSDSHDPESCRELYKTDANGEELDYRNFGSENADPCDIYCFFVRVKEQVLNDFVERDLLVHGRPRFLEHLFPQVSLENYRQNPIFLQKAEDLFVFNHSLNLTRILYVSTVLPEELMRFARTRPEFEPADTDFNFDDEEELLEIEYLTLMRDFIQAHPFEHHRHRYDRRSFKIAAVMSCGKNFATWKTAGREIPWQTPDAPNNIIHVRLATGSVVEQMNSHPFARLHTALTHNGETTNYEALKQRVQQFDLTPLATTDTEVAALKFHLTADAWEYPDWALFEGFSPTTGDDLKLVNAEIRHQLEEVQRVEFTSSPDGPYQYLCLRHNPYKKITERVDLKDPADLRPNVSAFWYDSTRDRKRLFSIIASEEHAIHTMLRLLEQEDIVDGAYPDQILVSSGMISRYHFDDRNQITDFEFIDRYGQKIELAESGEHYSLTRTELQAPTDPGIYQNLEKDYRNYFSKELKNLSFNDYRWLLRELVDQAHSDTEFSHSLEILTWLRDYVRTLPPGSKALSSLIDITQHFIDDLMMQIQRLDLNGYVHLDAANAGNFYQPPEVGQILVVDAAEFLPEGIDPDFTLGVFLARMYALGWRKFILYRTRGQRLISTAVMGNGDTDDVEMDVYGSVGEYFGAFMQGGIIRLHGNAQNFCAMCMHHGELYVFGNAGKVCGYASKGGKVFIMGNVVDRCWTNSVNDSRTQGLEIKILGSATKYAGESLMGGNFFFGGMHFDHKGNLRLNERPCLGTKMLGGASRGNFLFFDPESRLIEAQHVHGAIKACSPEEWQYFLAGFKEMCQLANVPIYRKNGAEYIHVDAKMVELAPDNFKRIVPKGGLKGYESH